MVPCCPYWSYLTTHLCFRSESLLLFRCPCCPCPGSGYQHKICLYRILKDLRPFLRILVEEEGSQVQYPEHIPPIPVYVPTLKTLFTASLKWTFWSHSVLTCLLVSSSNSYLFTLFLYFISEFPAFPVELSLHLPFIFFKKEK